jgi:hypothetical protein
VKCTWLLFSPPQHFCTTHTQSLKGITNWRYRYTGCFKKVWMIKTRSREEKHITTDEIWRTVHSNTSQVYLECSKLLHNTTARWQADYLQNGCQWRGEGMTSIILSGHRVYRNWRSVIFSYGDTLKTIPTNHQSPKCAWDATSHLSCGANNWWEDDEARLAVKIAVLTFSEYGRSLTMSICEPNFYWWINWDSYITYVWNCILFRQLLNAVGNCKTIVSSLYLHISYM